MLDIRVSYLTATLFSRFSITATTMLIHLKGICQKNIMSTVTEKLNY